MLSRSDMPPNAYEPTHSHTNFPDADVRHAQRGTTHIRKKGKPRPGARSAALQSIPPHRQEVRGASPRHAIVVVKRPFTTPNCSSSLARHAARTPVPWRGEERGVVEPVLGPWGARLVYGGLHKRAIRSPRREARALLHALARVRHGAHALHTVVRPGPGSVARRPPPLLPRLHVRPRRVPRPTLHPGGPTRVPAGADTILVSFDNA